MCYIDPVRNVLPWLLPLFAAPAPASAQIFCKGCPVNPCNQQAVMASFVQPVVFFAAHPDDETIGMAAAILTAVKQGRPVFIEMLTKGETSNVINILPNNSTDPWHPGAHIYSLTVAAFGNARVAELMDSACRMGVTGVRVSNNPSGALTAAQVTPRIQYWQNNSIMPLFKGVAGSNYLDPGTPGGTAHPDHVAVWDALVQTGISTVRGYLIYNYTTHVNHYSYVETHTTLCADKRYALDAYKVWQPNIGRYAVGFHSTPYLMNQNNVPDPPTSCVEYVVVPPLVPPMPLPDIRTF